MPESFKEKIQRKKTLVKDWFRLGMQKVSDGIRWVKENPQQVAVIASGIAGVSSIAKKGLRYASNRRETYNKQRFIYDRSMNAYVQTTRKLTGTDVSRINNLKRQGLRTSEALDRLGLLKR